MVSISSKIMNSEFFSVIFLILLALNFKISEGLDNNKCQSQNINSKSVPRIQIRAVLVRCPKKNDYDIYKASRTDEKNISAMRSEDILQFHGFDKDELLLHSEVKDCKRKLVITVKLNNCGSTMTEEEFIVVDHVYDPVVHKRSRLLNPLVFKLKQEQVLQLYGLTYANTINAEAREDVLNKNMPNYTGCDTTSSKPTCGMSYIKDKVIPFSEGFCCSCDSYVNLKRQPNNRNKENAGGYNLEKVGKKSRHFRSPLQEDEEDETEKKEYNSFKNKEFLGKGLWGSLFNSGPVDIKKTPDFTSFKSNKEFLGKGLWGSLYDSDVTDLKLKRKERSLDESRSSELTKYYENENLCNSLSFDVDDSYSVDKVLENEQRRFDVQEYNINFNDNINERYNEFSNNSDFGTENVEYDPDIDSPNDLLKISKEGLVCDKNVHENEKPKFIPTNHKFSLQSVIEMFKLKNKTKPYSQVQYHCLYPHLEHFDNPPLETAKGFLKSDINTSCRKSQSPWDVNLSDSPIQTNCGKKKSSDRKYVHILSKLIEQGIDPENDLHLTREDIIKKFKQPVKKNRYIKSVIHKARKNLRNKKYRNGPQRADRFDSYHFRKDNKQNRLFIKTNAKQSIEFDNNEQTILQNDSEDLSQIKPYYIVDIEWVNKSTNLIQNYDNSCLYDKPQNNLKSEIEENYKVNDFDNNVGMFSAKSPLCGNQSENNYNDLEINPLLYNNFHENEYPRHISYSKQYDNRSCDRHVTALGINNDNKNQVDLTEDEFNIYQYLNIGTNFVFTTYPSNVCNDKLIKNVTEHEIFNQNFSLNASNDFEINQFYYVSPHIKNPINNTVFYNKNPVFNKEILTNAELYSKIKNEIGKDITTSFSSNEVNSYDNIHMNNMKLKDYTCKPDTQSPEELINHIHTKTITEQATNDFSPNHAVKYLNDVGTSNILSHLDKISKMFNMSDNKKFKNKCKNNTLSNGINQTKQQIINNYNIYNELYNNEINSNVGNTTMKTVNNLTISNENDQNGENIKSNNSKNFDYYYSSNMSANDVKGLKTQPTDNSYTTSDNYLISSYSNEQSNSFYGKDLKYSEEFHISTQIIISKNFADTIEEFINVTDNEDIIYKPVSKLTNKEISPVTAKTNHKNMKKRYYIISNETELNFNENAKKLNNFSDILMNSRNYHNEFDDFPGKILNLKSISTGSLNKLNIKTTVPIPLLYFKTNNTLLDEKRMKLKQPKAVVNNTNKNVQDRFKFIKNICPSNKQCKINTFSETENNNKNYDFEIGSKIQQVDYRKKSRQNYLDLRENGHFNKSYFISNTSKNINPNASSDIRDEKWSPNLIRSYLNNSKRKNYSVIYDNKKTREINYTESLWESYNSSSDNNSNEKDKLNYKNSIIETFGGLNTVLSLLNENYYYTCSNNFCNYETTDENYNNNNNVIYFNNKNVLLNPKKEKIKEQSANSIECTMITLPTSLTDAKDDSLKITPDESNVLLNDKLRYNSYNKNIMKYCNRNMTNVTKNYVKDKETDSDISDGLILNNIRNNGSNNFNSLNTISTVKNYSLKFTEKLLEISSFNLNNSTNFISFDNITASSLSNNLNDNSSQDNEINMTNTKEKKNCELNLTEDNISLYKYMTSENMLADNINSNEKLRKKPKDNKSKTKKKKVKRQILSSGVQFRGGQSCIDRSVPSFADPVTYHESAHCLRFSDLWYTVYKLKHPFIEHSVHIQLYEKHNYQDGRTYWHEVTKGMTVNIGTFVKHVQDYLPTISFTYIPFTDENSGVFCLDPSKTTLLVPQPLPPSKAAEYPQVEAGPKEYLLVRDDEISVDGEECDKAGVSFEAFAKQPDRCAKPRGSCLNNQPLHMWMHDMEAKRNNKPGKYFLENYASIPQNPFKMNESTKEEYLALDYAGQFTSAIEVEVRSDLNAIVRTGAAGQLTEIYIDSTCDFHTRITVIVTNLGLASSAYFPRLSNCPVEVPDVWTHNEGPLADIAPQHRHIYRMSLYGALPVDRFHCSIELLNEKRELVATRRIRVQRQDRCLCQWHCLCACIGSVDGLRCIPMSAEHYHAAGFQGSLPVVTYAGMETEGSWTWHLYNMFLIYAATFLNILLLGLIKAFLGFCCCSQVGSWGLWLIFPGKAKELEDYKEPDIAHFPVIFDVAGYAVHPITGVRNVRFLSKSGEFCINLLFFAAAPIAIVIKLMKICCPCFRSEPNQWDDIGQPSGVEEEPLLPETNEKIDKKKEEIIKAKKQKLLLGSDKTDSGSNWSLPSDLEIDENDVDTEYVLQERYASQKNLQQNRRSRGGADIPSPRSGIYGFLKDSFTDTKNFRDNLSELEKEMAEHLVDTLQEAYIVYRNLRNPCGGVKLQPGTSYCVKGFFTKSGSTFKFTPPPPLLQYWTEDNKPITPPCTLSISDFEVEFKTAEEVLLGNEISVLPRGVVINVWHSLDSMQQTEPF